MKNIVLKSLAVLAMSAFTISCTKDDTNEEVSGTGSLTLKYDNSFGGNDLILTTQTNTTSNNEVLKVDKIKYIVSNIVLTKSDGTVFTYPKSQSYFIVDEATPSSLAVTLKDVPAGDYTKVKFGIGVDKAQWELGATGQGDFLTQASAAGMMWSWSSGYKFLAFEGSFTSATVTTAANYKIHVGQTGTDYNYAEVSLDMPTKALVRTTITPSVHLIADLGKIIDGKNKIKLSEGATLMGGAVLATITENITGMFTVDHVHND